MDFNFTINATWKWFYDSTYPTLLYWKRQANARILFALLGLPLVSEVHVFICFAVDLLILERSETTTSESPGQYVYIIHINERLDFGSLPSDHYFRSVCWFVCLSVCLFVCLFVCLCRVFLSRLWSDFDQTRTYVTYLGLVVSPRI